MIRLALVGVIAAVVWIAFGWRYVLPPLLGLAIWAWASATLRSMVGGHRASTEDAGPPSAVGPNDRTLYWCEECGTEYLLLIRGSGSPPRHCGTTMHERTEILS